jgi:hypothetical protein
VPNGNTGPNVNANSAGNANTNSATSANTNRVTTNTNAVSPANSNALSMPPPDIKPRVYIQIQDENQRDDARKIQKALQGDSFLAPGIELVGTRSVKTTEVRYFRPQDAEIAEEVRDLLVRNRVSGVTVRYIRGFEDSKSMRPRHIELWFSADAFGNPKY